MRIFKMSSAQRACLPAVISYPFRWSWVSSLLHRCPVVGAHASSQCKRMIYLLKKRIGTLNIEKLYRMLTIWRGATNRFWGILYMHGLTCITCRSSRYLNVAWTIRVLQTMRVTLEELVEWLTRITATNSRCRSNNFVSGAFFTRSGNMLMQT